MITPRDRVGLVGANGTGKSTLMKILAGLETLDYGSISTAKGISAGYLAAGWAHAFRAHVFAECMSVFSELRGLEQEMEDLTGRMSELDHSSQEYSQVAERYHRIEHEFRTRDGYAIEAQVGTVLSGLGFRKEDWNRQNGRIFRGLADAAGPRQAATATAEPFAAGRTDESSRPRSPQLAGRVSRRLSLRFCSDLARPVLSRCNHQQDCRDLEQADSSLQRQLREVSGQKTQRLEQLEAAYRNQRERIEQLEVFINRFRYQATKAKQVQSRIKELERMERIELPEEEKTIHFSFPQPKPSGRIVAEFQGVAKAYGEKQVFSDVSFMIERGDRIALVGVNGAGKSTLIKLLAEQEPLTGGEYRLGHNAQPDYFAQDQYKELDPDARILDDLGRALSALHAN